MASKWKCPTCGSTDVQIALPAWYRESQNCTLTFVSTDEEADPLYWACDNETCNDSGNGAPSRNDKEN